VGDDARWGRLSFRSRSWLLSLGVLGRLCVGCRGGWRNSQSRVSSDRSIECWRRCHVDHRDKSFWMVCVWACSGRWECLRVWGRVGFSRMAAVKVIVSNHLERLRAYRRGSRGFLIQDFKSLPTLCRQRLPRVSRGLDCSIVLQYYRQVEMNVAILSRKVQHVCDTK